MATGKLTIQAWHEKQERETAREIERDRQLDQLGRELDSLGDMLVRRRRQGLFRRFIRSISLGF